MRILSIACFLSLALSALPAAAQDKEKQDPCAYNREVIAGLARPRFGEPAIWESARGAPDLYVQYMAALPFGDGEGAVTVLGRTLDPKTLKPKDIFLSRIDRRGRALLETKRPARPGETPSALVETKDGFAVLSAIGPKGGRSARVALYSRDGLYKGERLVHDPNSDTTGTDLKALPGGGLALLLHVADRRGGEKGALVRLAASGAILWRRTFDLGAPDMLTGVMPLKDGFIATGRLRGEDGRMNGWALRLDPAGAIMWQRAYPRGAFALIRAAAVLPGGFAFIGDSSPADGAPGAAWLMIADGGGNPVWQRYYRSADSVFTGAAVAALPDGRISMMINARPLAGAQDPPHLRLLTVSPDGALLQAQSFVRGAAARGYGLAAGRDGERIVAASIDAGRGETTTLTRPFQGWVFAAPAPETWTNPCVKSP